MSHFRDINCKYEELRHKLSFTLTANKSYFWLKAGRSENVAHNKPSPAVWRRQKNAHLNALLAVHFFLLGLPLRAECHWKYRQAQSAILIPLPCPSHAHSIHPDPTHSHSCTHTHPPSPSHLMCPNAPPSTPTLKKRAWGKRESLLEGCTQQDLGVCKGQCGLCSIWGFISATAGQDNGAARRATETQAVAAKLLHW